MLLNGLDWTVIAAFFAILVAIPAFASLKTRKGGGAEYFRGANSMPWWLIGVSMVAATTSTNSANLFTEIIRRDGLSGNWVWWAFLTTGMLTVFVYSKLWVRSGATTDIAFYELRYSGRPAAFLRGFRAVYLGVIYNLVVMATVLLGAIKIGCVMFGVSAWTVLAVTAVASLVYSCLSGIRGTIYTDFFLFAVVMLGAFAVMHYAVNHPAVGGWTAMMADSRVAAKTSFLPDFSKTDALVAVFVIPVAVQWWNVWYSGSEPGGGGYIVQRMLTAKTPGHALGGTLFFNVLNYALRPWPWYIAAFASILVFPDLDAIRAAFPGVDPALVGDDMAYPALVKIVPNGWVGVVAASLMGALFSTIAAQLSMGANYVTNDIWKRFVRKDASDRELILVARVASVLLMLLGCVLAPLLESAKSGFDLMVQVGAGTGLVFLLRWFWMRINAWTEIVAMAVSFLCAVFFQLVWPHVSATPLLFWHKLLLTIAVTTVAWVGTTFATAPEDPAVIANFRSLVRAKGRDVGRGVLLTFLGAVAIFCFMALVARFMCGREGAAKTSAATAATLFFAGDSTLDDAGYSHGGRIRFPYCSWGTELEKSMKAGCHVSNFARSGASTKSFLTSGQWDRLIAEVKEDDFVAIQFGHNDQKRSTDFYLNERYADPKGLFREIVRGWVAEVRAKGATPLLLSPICRGTFDATGTRLVDTAHQSDGVCLESYRDAMAELSEELKCDFVDMNALTRRLMERVGREEAEKFFVVSTGLVLGKDGEPAKDVTHPIQSGAAAFAKLFLDDVKSRGLSVAGLFKDRDFSIADFGAKPDGSKCTEAFGKAIRACAAAGGGRVVVPPGTWLTGSVKFRSNCELHLSEGAKVVFSQDPADYLPAVQTTWEGMECINYSPLVYAYCCTNVAITGTGTLCGYEGRWPDTTWYPWVPQTNGVKAARLQLYTWGATDYPVEKREIYKLENAHTRPQLVQFNRCKGVVWRDFKVRNSPFWTLHLYMCEDAVVQSIDVSAHGGNNDGIDVEMSRDVTIENCRFDQGDDGIVIKSGRNRDAWRLATPTENVFIRDCEVVNAHTLLGIGSEISGGVRNVRLVNCRAGDVDRGIFIKTNRRRGGTIEKISVDGVEVARVKRDLVGLSVDTLYQWADFPDYENRTTVIRDIVIRNVHGGKAGCRVNIVGDAKVPVDGLRLENVTVESAERPDRIVNAVNVTAPDVRP